MAYESPELEIRWFKTEDICKDSLITDPLPGDSVGGEDIFDDWGDNTW